MGDKIFDFFGKIVFGLFFFFLVLYFKRLEEYWGQKMHAVASDDHDSWDMVCFFKGKQLAPKDQSSWGQSAPTPIIVE